MSDAAGLRCTTPVPKTHRGEFHPATGRSGGTPRKGAFSPGAIRWKLNPASLAASSSRFAAARSGPSAISSYPLRDQAPQAFDALDYLRGTEQPQTSPHHVRPDADHLILTLGMHPQPGALLLITTPPLCKHGEPG
jgi:hypothetical protein